MFYVGFVRYILQVVGSISGVIRDKCCSLSAGRKDCVAVCQGLAHLLLYLTHMFQSGNTSNRSNLVPGRNHVKGKKDFQISFQVT